MNYQEFLKDKKVTSVKSGFVVKDLNENLFPFQGKIVRKALENGKFAIFADCGLGKTIMQLEWSHQVSMHTKGKVLILTPLAVSLQTQEEAQKFGIDAKVVSSQEEIDENGIYITNYEKLHKFDVSVFSGVVLDESSILKNMDGKTRTKIIESFDETPYKLACTATPSPNDFVELGNHCQFLNIISMQEMLALFFINDAMSKGGKQAIGWRLKKHAEDEFWKFVGTWSYMLQKPSDMGDDDGDFDLPTLTVTQHIIESQEWEDTLFPMPAQSLSERREARKSSLDNRILKTKEIADSISGQCLIWCDFNNEADSLAKMFPDAVEIRGADKDDKKVNAALDFAHGDIDMLISKPSMFGMGVNWQSCNNIIFCGLSDSYEQYYQAIRRCWRFGQKNKVNVHIVMSDREISVLENIERKHSNHDEMFKQMIKNIHSSYSSSHTMEYKEHDIVTDNYTALLGDCCERIKDIEDASVGFSIFSPPFASLYTYSNSERDMGNCVNADDFADHFKFLIPEIYRTMKPGRNVAIHCMNLPTSKQRDGYIGIRDFRGDLIRMFVDCGFIYHSEVCIWKDPVVAMQRTKALGLLHKQIKKDSVMSRQGLPDYLVVMRKPGENNEPISHTAEEFPVDEWQKIASPIWTDIRQSNTLQKKSAREEKDEKHICPLQLDVIERALYLWSNPDDTILSPFMGIGSEGYVSLKLGRKFIGIELKKSYYDQAVKNLHNADESKKQLTMF